MALFNILVDIAAKTAGLESGVKRVEDKLSSMEGFAKKAGTAFAGLFAADQIIGFTKGALDAASAAGDAADRIGILASEYSKLSYAAKQSSVDSGSLDSALKSLQKNLSEAAGGSSQAAAKFDRIGISVANLRGLAADKQFAAIAEAFGRLTDDADRTAVAMELFGKSGAELIPLLAQGEEGIRKFAEEADRLGITLDDRATKAIDRSQKALDKWISSAKSSVSNGIGSFIANWFGSGDEVLDLQNKIDTLQEGIDRILDARREWGEDKPFFDGEALLQKLKQQKAALVEQRDALVLAAQAVKDRNSLVAEAANIEERWAATQRDALKPAQDFISQTEAYKKAVEARKKSHSDAVDAATNELRMEFETVAYYRKLDEDTMTRAERAAARYVEQLEKINNLRGKDQSVINARKFNNFDEYMQGIGAWKNAVDNDVVKKDKDATEEMSENWKTFTRNAQSSLANFLYDPFKDGLKGMLAAFVDTLRRMAAEAAAAKIFESFGTLFGFSGGGNSAGGLAEAFAGGSAFGPGGSDKSAPVIVNNTVTVGSNSNVTKGEIVAAMKQSSDETVARIQDMKRRGRF